MRRIMTFAVAIAWLAPATLASQAIIRGRIIDARTARPLRDVAVIVTAGRDTLGRARSDSDGVFQSAVAAPGQVVAHFAKIGYHADSLKSVAGAEFPMRIAMLSLGGMNELATMVISDSSRNGFQKRAQRTFGGTFLKLADIQKRMPVKTSDLFRFLPGVTLADSAGTTLVVSTRGQRELAQPTRAGKPVPTSNARVCALRVGMDGRLMQREFSVDEVRPEDIYGIELYLGAATIPLEFQSVQRDDACGIIMIWTKNGAERRP
jgi:hypothetical protein